MDIKIKRFLLTGFIVALGAASVDLNAMKRRADQPAENVLQEDNQEQGAPAIAPQPDAQRQQARTIRFPQGKRRKMVELPIADNFEKRDDGWYYKGYNGGRWDNTKIKKAEILEALNALDAAVNNAVNQIVAQGPQNLQAVVQNNNQQIKEIVVQTLAEERAQLKQDLDDTKSKITVLEQAQVSHKDTITELGQQIKQGLDNTTDKITKVGQELSDCKKQIIELTQKNEQQQNELVGLRQQQEQMNARLTTVEDEIKLHTQKITSLMQDVDIIKRRIKYMIITGVGFVAAVAIGGVVLYLTWPQIVTTLGAPTAQQIVNLKSEINLLGAKTAQIADLNKKVEALQAIKSFSNCCAQGTSTVSSSVLIGQQQGALSKVINTAGSGSKMILDWLNPLTWFSK